MRRQLSRTVLLQETAGEGETITLTLDNDESIECSILTIYEAAGNEYIALLPLNEKGENEDGEVYIYRYHQENGTPILENIENDESMRQRLTDLTSGLTHLSTMSW